MKKIILGLVVICLLTSCSLQKQLNAFGKKADIAEAVVFVYIPLYQSYMPDPICIVDNATDITELTTIINRTRRTDKIRDVSEMMGGPGTFTYEIRFNGNSLTTSQIYILIDEESIFISTIELFDQDESGYVLYQVQQSDRNAFLDKLGVAN